MKTLPKWAAFSLYPVLLTLSVVSYLVLSKYSDVSYLVPKILACVFIFLAIVERKFPRRTEWKVTFKDVYHGIGHLLINRVMLKEAIEFIIIGILTMISPLLQIHTGMQTIPFAGQCIIGILIIEIMGYELHRFAHNSRFWKSHAIHHAQDKMSVFSTAVASASDVVSRLIMPFMILVLIGLSPEAIGFYLVFSGSIALLQHCNLELKTGFLNYVFMTPELHSLHHSKQKLNGNYAISLSCIDWMRGTLKYEKNQQTVQEVGVKNFVLPKNFWKQVFPILQRRALYRRLIQVFGFFMVAKKSLT